MTIDYIPGTTSNLVGDPAEGGAFSSGNKGELSGANTAAANAATSATAAAASQTAAAQSASDLSAAEANAGLSAAAAAASAASASTSQGACSGFLGSISSLYDNFDDRYLGAKTSEPTLDNDGGALLVGAMYFNSTSNLMKVYNGSAWQVTAVDSTTILLKAQNLADLPSVSTARTNLGLGTMALETATDYAELAGATFTGDVTAPEFIGVLQGETVFKAKAGEALSKGDAVYVSGISGNTPVVSKADADGANTYPAFGLASADAANNNTLDVITAGQLKNFDTSGFTLGDTLYLSTTPGVLTATPPTGEGSVIQNIGKVEREHASAGSILVVGAGRAAATPNLNQNNVFVGNASNQAVTQNIGTALSGATVPTLTVTTSNSTTVDTTNLEATNLKAKDGTAAGSIADSTGIVTLASSVLTTADINGGTIDGVTIGANSVSGNLSFADNTKAIFGNDGNELALYHNTTDSIIEDQGTGSLLIKGTQLKLQSAAGEDYATFTSNGPARLFNNGVEKFATSSTGATVAGRLNTGQIEVTTLRANDGTGAGSIADSTGVTTLNSAVLTTADINGGTIDGTVIGGSTAATGTFTTIGSGDITITDASPKLAFIDSDGTNQKTEQVQAGGSFVTTVRNNTSHGSIDFKSNNGTNNLLRFRVATDGDFNFYENDGSTVGVKWDAPNGRLGIGTTSPSAALDVVGKIETSEGIYLGGTGGSNLLDDYEEGTWTPVMRDASSGGNVAGAANLSGVYTKIGRHVNLTIRVINVSKTGMTSSNDIYITGLPFAASDLSPSFRHIGNVESTRIDFGNSIQSRITENTSYMMLSSSTSVGGLGTINWNGVDDDEGGAGVADLFITHTYIAD